MMDKISSFDGKKYIFAGKKVEFPDFYMILPAAKDFIRNSG